MSEEFKVIIQKQSQEESQVKETNMNGFVFKRGRPKELIGNLHYFSARINEDLWNLATKKAQEAHDNSVNAYLNYLIAKDNGLV